MTLLLASGLMLAGCISSDGTADSTTTQDATATTVTTTAPPKTIITTADDTSVVPSTTTAGGARECPEELEEGTSLRLEGDLDGNGLLETVAVDRPLIGETTIQVCQSGLAVVPFKVGDTNKPAEVYLIDIEGDGMAELLVGGPTGAARFVGSIVRLAGSTLTDLGLYLSVSPGGRTGTSFGCVDVDDDGQRELVTLTYEFDADSREASTSVTWTRVVVLDDDAVESTATGVFNTATQPVAVAALVSGTCGEETIIDIG